MNTNMLQLPSRQTDLLPDVEHTYEGIRLIDMVPNLSPQNLVSVEIGKDFMLSHGYIKNDFDVHKWAAPEFLEKAARELLEMNGRKEPLPNFLQQLIRCRQEEGSGKQREGQIKIKLLNFYDIWAANLKFLWFVALSFFKL